MKVIMCHPLGKKIIILQSEELRVRVGLIIMFHVVADTRYLKKAKLNNKNIVVKGNTQVDTFLKNLKNAEKRFVKAFVISHVNTCRKQV